MQDPMTAPAPATQQGWWEQLQNKLDSEWLEQFDLSTQSIVEIAAYCGIGFLIGFLAKRYGRTLFVTVAAAAVLLWVLSYVAIVSVHWEQLRLLLGISEAATFETFLQSSIGWVKDHVRAVVSGLIGFFVGYKAG